MSMNGLKSRTYLAATTTITTALAIYALCAPHNEGH